MAGLGLKNFGSEILTSNDVDGYLMQQTVMVFASSAARTTAFTAASLSPSEGMVSYLQDTNKIQVYNGSTWIGLNDVTLEAISVDSSGRVTFPYQPAFMANGSLGGTNYSNASIPFSNVISNRGGHYSTATNRFTAPVTGYYHFEVTMLNYPNTTGSGEVGFVVNGASSYAYTRWFNIVSQNSLTASVTLSLAVNDYVNVFATLSVYNSGYLGNFSGFLVG